MSSTEPDQPTRPGTERAERTVEDVLWGRVRRKRERIRAEIRRNRAGNHTIPTSVLAAVLALILAGWLYLMVTG